MTMAWNLVFEDYEEDEEQQIDPAADISHLEESAEYWYNDK